MLERREVIRQETLLYDSYPRELYPMGVRISDDRVARHLGSEVSQREDYPLLRDSLA